MEITSILIMDSKNTKTSQEIDLSVLYKKVSSLFGRAIYNLVRFIMKNALILIVLIVIGGLIGYFLDRQKSEIYKHEVIIIPNFESHSYLYKEIRNKKFDENSPIFSVEIEPIIDVYHFITSGNNLKIAEYLSTNNIKFHEYKPNNQAEKIYQQHLLTIYTHGEDPDGSIIDNFLKNLNQVSYFSEKQKIEVENIIRQINDSEVSIKNIDRVFETLGSSSASGSINIEMNPQLGVLLENKKDLVESISWLKVKLFERSKVFNDISRFSNINVKPSSNKITIPLILIFLFAGLGFVKKIYNQYNNLPS